MSLILHIDTSLEVASVSISRNGRTITSLENKIQKEHAAFIHYAIQNACKEVCVHLTDIQAVGVSIGPGSYTGLRVGLSAAKGLSYALAIPLITVGTLTAMAQAAVLKNNDCTLFYCPMIDARRNEVYTAVYSAQMGEQIAPQPMVLDECAFSEMLKEKNIIFFGSGSYKWKGICINHNASFGDTGDLIGGATLIAYSKYCDKNFADIKLTIPLYTKDFFNDL